MATGIPRRVMHLAWLLAVGLLLSLQVLPASAQSTDAQSTERPAPIVQLPVQSHLALKPYLLINSAENANDSLQSVITRLDDSAYWHSPLKRNVAPVFEQGDHPFWIQLRLHNPSNTAQHVWIDQPHAAVKQLSLFVLRQHDILQHFEAGTTVPMSRWPADTRTTLFPITVEPGDTLTVLMYNDIMTSLVVNDFTLWQRDAYATRFDGTSVLHWMYNGCVLLMILYNLVLFVITRDRSYLYYVFFGAACWATFFAGNGYERWLFWPEATAWNIQSFHLYHSLQFITAILFAQNFLNIREKSPRGFWFLNTLAALVALSFVGQILSPLPHQAAFVGLRFLVTVPILLTLWIIPLQLLLKGDRIALLYFVGASAYLIAWMLTTLWVLGVLDSMPIIRDAVTVGQAIELVVLSVALANRINESKQRERAAHLAMEAKSVFLASMSHEIRTPMNGVVSMSDLLMTMNLPVAAKQCASIIHSSTLSLISVINEILDYSKLEAGKLSLHEELCDPVLSVRDAVVLFEAQAAEKRLALTAIIDHDVPQSLRLDSTRLRQILMNLISNAIKFTTRGSLTVQMRRTEKQLVITVSDTGIGMTPEQTARLFRVYQQAGSDIAGRFGGTGLGLAICKELAELMNGAIEVDSSPQRGSVFTLRIPMREPLLRLPPISCRHVCLLSDDNHYASLLRQWFERQKIGLDVFDDARVFRTWCAGHDRGQALALIDSTLLPPMLAAFTDVLDVYPAAQIAFLPSIRNAINARPDVSDSARIIAASQHLPRTVVSMHWWTDLAKPQLAQQRPLLPRARVLVAEDDATNRIIIEKLLRELGQDVTLTNDGEQALDAFFSRQFDVLLIDCEMPKLDGINATRRIRALQKGPSKTPIIALTAHSSQEIAAEYLDAGANIILTKPINLQRLQSALESALQLNRR